MTKIKKSNRKNKRKSNCKNIIKKQGGARDFYTKFILIINSMQQISLNKLDETKEFLGIYNHFFSQIQELNKIKLEEKKLQFYSNISKFFNETDRLLFNLQYINNYLLQNSLIENDEDNKTILIKFYDRINEKIKNINDLYEKIKEIKNEKLKSNYMTRILQNINIINNFKNQFIMIIHTFTPRIFLNLTQNISNNKKIIKDNLCSFCSIDKKSIKKKNDYQVEILNLFPSFNEEINPCNIKNFIQNYTKQINIRISNIIKSDDYTKLKEYSGKINIRGGGLFKTENKIQKFNNLLKDISELPEDKKLSKEILKNTINELIKKHNCREWISIKDKQSMDDLFKNINDNLAGMRNTQANIANIMSQPLGNNQEVSVNELAAEFGINLNNVNSVNNNLGSVNSNNIDDDFSLGWNLVLTDSLNRSRCLKDLIIILSNMNSILNEYNDQINLKNISMKNLEKEFS